MNETPVYLFKSDAPRKNTVVCVAALELVVSVYGGGGLHDSGSLSNAFGGAIFFRNEATRDRYLGVWGTRNASRFRSTLRSRATIEVVGGPPPARLVWFETRGVRPARQFSVPTER